MAVDRGLVAWVVEAMEPIGTVRSRAMMGGATLSCDGTPFALIADDTLWLKADTVSDGTWDAADCPRFTYAMRDGRAGTMNYRRAPDDTYDDADALRQWGRLALEAGLRAPRKTKGRSSTR